MSEVVYIVGDSDRVLPTGLIETLARQSREPIVINQPEQENMGSMNRSLLAAALLSGLVVATGRNGQNMAPQAAAREVEFNDDHWRSGKGRNKNPRRASGAAVLKRAAAKRRNIRARSSKRA